MRNELTESIRRIPCSRYMVVSMLCVLACVSSSLARTIFTDSFESPVVSGRVLTDPDGWIGADPYGANSDGIENEGSGTFTTPHGAQAACVWNGNRSLLHTSESQFDDVLVPGIKYTVTCNVAKPTDLSGAYWIELRAFDAGDTRADQYHGDLVARIQGTATKNDMTEQATFSFTAAADDPNAWRQLGIRIKAGDCVVDNLVFEDDGDGSDIYPPALSYQYPRENQTTMATDYPLVLTFNETVIKGTGTITIAEYGGEVLESIDVTSGQVVISNNLVTVNRNEPLERGKPYYATIDQGAFTDLALNDFVGILTANDWRFDTPVPDGPHEIYTTSFESPVVSGLSVTEPDGWILGNGYGASAVGLANEDTGLFVTPYGSQAGSLWQGDRSLLTTRSNVIENLLIAEWPYTVSFNTIKLDGRTPSYNVELVAFAEGESRAGTTDQYPGAVLAEVSGNAILRDGAAQTDAFTFTAALDSEHIGKQLAIRIHSKGTIDNLRFTWRAPPPAGTVLLIQ